MYDTNKATLSCTLVSPQLEVITKENSNLSYYDNQKRYWSIYGTQVEFSKFIAELKTLSVQVKDSKEKEPFEKSFETSEKLLTSAEMSKDDKESDTDSSVYKKTKDSILKRMAIMGHSVLPTQSVPLTKSDESSDSDESAQKVIRHKPQKSNVRKNLMEKVDLHSNDYTNINLKRNTSIMKLYDDILLSEQQIVPIKSTNIITNPNINTSNELNMFMSEQRISNSELRININRLSDKMDKILERVQGDSEIKSCANHFQNNLVQKLLDEYENKIKCYENFLDSKGIDYNIISKTIKPKEHITDNISERDTYTNKIQELSKNIEEKIRENSKLKLDIENLHEKYENFCSEFEKKCNNYTKEVNTLKQELNSKNEEILTISKKNESTVPNVIDVKNKLKSIMNETFHSLSAHFTDNEHYEGAVIKSIVADVIKKETLKAIKDT